MKSKTKIVSEQSEEIKKLQQEIETKNVEIQSLESKRKESEQRMQELNGEVNGESVNI